MKPYTASPLVLAASLLLACSDPGPEPKPEPLPMDHDEPAPDPGEEEPREEEEPGFELVLSTDKLPVLQGSQLSFTVSVRRKNGFAEPILLSGTGLPDGVSLEPVSLSPEQDEVTLQLRAAATAPHSLPKDVVIRGVAGGLEAEEHAAVTVYGAPGTLDTSFASEKAVFAAGKADDYAYAMATQADGKLVLVGQSAQNLGDVAVMRLSRDGGLDASFGNAGTVQTSIGSGSETGYAVAVQPDGKILVAGSSTVQGSGLDFALLRYLPDGKLDATFGSSGVVTTKFTDDADTAYAIALQADGKIVVGGEANRGTSATGVDFALARYLPNGTLDESFGAAGKVMTSLVASSGRDTIYALVLQQVAGETRILAAGGEGDFALARYTPSGELDASFGNAGKRIGVLGSSIGAARALTLDAQGRILVAGHHTNDFALLRLAPDGSDDPSFGSQGKVVTPVSKGNWDAAHGVVVQADGHIVVGGWVYEGQSSSGNFALVRYDASGRLDAGFGAQGITITDVSGPSKRDEARAIVLQSDERVPTVRVVAAGFASGSNQDFAAARYWL